MRFYDEAEGQWANEKRKRSAEPLLLNFSHVS